jgi:type IV pilus assembly protein PilX
MSISARIGRPLSACRAPAMSAQRGAALVVALVLLMIMTLMGVAGMRAATLELQMAGNYQFAQLAFQAAESAIKAEIEAGGLSTNLNRNVAYSYPTANPVATVNANTQFISSGAVPAGGYSLGASFIAYHFEVQAAATSQRNATSNQAQGFYIVGPG